MNVLVLVLAAFLAGVISGALGNAGAPTPFSQIAMTFFEHGHTVLSQAMIFFALVMSGVRFFLRETQDIQKDWRKVRNGGANFPEAEADRNH